MSERSEGLAAKFEQPNNDVIATVEAASDEQWAATCEEEGWSVAVTAHHIGSGYTPLTGLVQAMASGAAWERARYSPDISRNFSL